jgi:hypothetical protein
MYAGYGRAGEVVALWRRMEANKNWSQRHRADETEDDRVTIGRRACSPAGADSAVRSADVFDDDGLTERHPHALGHNSPCQVRNAARGYRRNHGDRPRRIGLRPRVIRRLQIAWAERGVRKEEYVQPWLRRMVRKNAYGVYFVFKSME